MKTGKTMKYLVVLMIAVLCAVTLATAAGESAHAGYPAIIEGLDFGGQTVYIYDWWSSGEREAEPTEEQQRVYDYQDWLEETYNVHVVEIAWKGWTENPTELAKLVANQDDSKLCIIAVASDYAGDPLKNGLFMPWTYGLDDGNTAVQSVMTRNGVCYGTGRSTYSEPRQGVFFNKTLLEAAGIDWNEIYEAQSNGTWTWAKMEEYMVSVQRDTNHDGQIDVWGLTGNGDDITIGLVVSNGAEFYAYDENGLLAPAIESNEMREALACRQAWNAYMAPSPSWDSYQQNWREGKAAFMIGQAYEGFNGNGAVNTVADWGFVAMPKGTRMDHYATAVENNIYGIPNVYDAETSLKLQQLFRLWTRPLPGNEDAWSDNFTDLTDENAIATYGMLREPACGTAMNYNLVGGRNTAASAILWSINGGTVDEVINEALPVFQEICDDFNTVEDIQWILENGVLTISGTGKMKTHPWTSRAAEINEVVIEEGITTICRDAFRYCSNMAIVRIPFSVSEIGEGAFPVDSCTSLADIYYNGLEIDWDGGVLPWGDNDNGAAVNARMHYLATSPAPEGYTPTLTGINREGTDTALVPGEDGAYSTNNNEFVLVSCSASDMQGYTKSYRIRNFSWWDTLPVSIITDDGFTGYSLQTARYGQEETSTAEVLVIYFPEDFPADSTKPVYTASLNIDFHIFSEPTGIEISMPKENRQNPDGYPLTVEIPDTLDLDRVIEWGVEVYCNEEFCYSTGGSGGTTDLHSGTNVLIIPDGKLDGPGRYDVGFYLGGIGYEWFGQSISFTILGSDLTMVPQFGTEEPIWLWEPVCMEIHASNSEIRNCTVQVFLSEENGSEQENTWDPQWVWIDENGYGEYWFTPGAVDVDIFEYETRYNQQNYSHRYTVYAKWQQGEDEAIFSKPISFWTEMLPDDPPAFEPSVTGVSSGSLRQDEFFRATVSNAEAFDIVCLVVFDENGYVADSHWKWTDQKNPQPIELASPLVQCEVNKEYTAKIYGLKYGYPMVYYSQEWPFHVIGAADGDADSDIRIGGLKDSYSTGERIGAAVYYPNSEELDNIVLDIIVSSTDDPDYRPLEKTVWPEREQGGLIFNPEEDWEFARCWRGGKYRYDVTVWQEDENGEFVRVDGTQRIINVTSAGAMKVDPGLPEYIEASEMPYRLTIPRVSDADEYYIRIENWDDHDSEEDPEWDPLIGEYSQEDEDGPDSVLLRGINQRINVHIEAVKSGYDEYWYDTVIPIVNLGNRVSIRTDESLTGELPIHTYIPLWINAEGAERIRLEENGNGCGDWGGRAEIARGIETGCGLNREGANHFIATAGFYDEATDTWTEEQAILVVHGYLDGNAGVFTATLEHEEATRGDTVNVTYTKSENADHYWVDLDVWNDERNDWEWYDHLADLNVEGENNGGTVPMNTITLVPNTYRVRALAEGLGYSTYEYVITEAFTVHGAEIPESGMLVTTTAENNQVETCEEFGVSALAPGANWIQIFWDNREVDENRSENSDWHDAYTWYHNYSDPGEYVILVRAWFDELDENGDPIEEYDAESGNTYTKQYNIEETISISVTAEKGKLELTAPEGIPAKLAPAEKTIAFTVRMPENATYLRAEAWLEGVDDGNVFWGDTWNGDLTVRFNVMPEVGQALIIQVRAEGRGYEASELCWRIPVLPEGEASDLAFISANEGAWYTDDEGLVHVPVHGHIQFLVSAAKGHSLTAVKFFGMNGWWEEGREISHENHDDWFNIDGSAFFHENADDERQIGSVTEVYAMVRVDGGNVWHVINPMQVYTDDYWVGPYAFTSTEPMTVPYGEDAVFTFTESKGANRYWVDAWDADNAEGENYNLDTTFSGTTVTMNTAQLHVGEFIIRGRAGTEENDLREADNDVRLIVTPSDVAEGEIIVKVDRTEVLTNEEIYASIFAPGADRVEIIARYEDGRENDFVNRSDCGAAGSIRENNPQMLEIFGKAYYYERNENGEYVSETSKESTKELVTVSAPNGLIEQDGSGIPVRATAGEDLTLTMPRDENATYMGWELYLNRDYNNDDQERDEWGEAENELNLTISGEKLIAGNTVELRVWTGGVGYEHNHRNYRIQVTEGAEERVTVAVSKNEVLVNEDFTVTVTAPGAERIRFFNGEDFRKEWNNELLEEVVSEFEPDENGRWTSTESYGNSGVMGIYALAWINGEWVASDPVKVTAIRNGRVDEPEMSISDTTVTRGDLVWLRYEPAANSKEEYYDLHHDRNREKDGENFVPYDLNWQRDTDAHCLTFSTAGMPAGEYTLWVWIAGAEGYEGRDTQRFTLTVEEPEHTGNTVRLEAWNTNVQTFESFRVSVSAPGAAWIEIDWDENGQVWNNDGGDSWICDYDYGNAGTHLVYARAHYGVEGLETTVDSEPVTITVTSNGEQIPLDLTGIPAVLYADQAATIRVPKPENARHLGWNIWLDRDYNDGWQEPDYRNGEDENELNITIPANTLRAGAMAEVSVWTHATGYENNHRQIRIPVLETAPESLGISLDKASVQTCENADVTITFPAGTYQTIQLNNNDGYWDEDGLNSSDTERTYGVNYDRSGTYTLFARLRNGENQVYTKTVELEVTAPKGALTFDTSMVPERIYEGRDAAFTLVKPEIATEWDYSLRDDTDGADFEIEWGGNKDGAVTIPANKVIEGHRYVLDYNARAQGYEAVNASVDITAYAAPSATLSADKKTVSYGETVTFTVYAPGADEKVLYRLNGEGNPEQLGSLTWTADRIGTVQFTANAMFDGFNEPVQSNMITVNVRSLGAAPAPAVDAPESAGKGDTISITVTPVKDGWASVSIYDSGTEPVLTQNDITAEQTLSVENVHAGAYQVYIFYGKDGYDDGEQIEIEIPVSHAYSAAPVWTWADDYSSAYAVFTCDCGEATEKVDAAVSSEITKEPSCSETGVERYTATVTFRGSPYTDEKPVTLAKTAHDWGEPVFNWTETGNGYAATAVFTCRNNPEHTRSEEADVTKAGHTEATCTEAAATVYEAKCEGFTDRKAVPEGEPNGHSGTWRIAWNDDYTAYASYTCEICGETETAEATVTSEITKPATCSAKGEMVYTATAVPGGEEITSTKKQYLSKTKHTLGEPTWTEEGMELIKCSACGTVLSCEYPHGEHQWTTTYQWADDYSTVTATRTCTATPEHPHSETETVHTVCGIAQEPTCDEMGSTGYTAVFTKDCFEIQTKSVMDIPAGHSWGSPTYEWNEDLTRVTAKRVCRRNEAHSETETAQATSSVIIAPTDTESGVVASYATFTSPVFGWQESVAEIPALQDMNVLRLPAAMTTIEEEAFAGISSEAVIIPDGCERIEKKAFASCSNLRYVWIPRTVSYVAEDAFAGCGRVLVNYESEHTTPVLHILLTRSSVDYAQSESAYIYIAYPDGTTAGLEEKYPNARISSVLYTADGEVVDRFIEQINQGLAAGNAFPFASDDVPAGDYQIRVTTNVAGLSGASRVFHYTADKSNLSDPSECSIKLTLSTESLSYGEQFTMTATVTDRNGKPATGIKVGFMILDQNGNTYFCDPYSWLWHVTGASGQCAIRYVDEEYENVPAGTYTARIFLVDTDEDISDEKTFTYSGR